MKAYEQFKKKNQDEYQAIDRQCESLTEDERESLNFRQLRRNECRHVATEI